MKIIHCADLHLGSRENKELGSVASQRKSELIQSVKNMVDYAKKNDIKVILLSGDVFDSDSPSKKDKNFFYDLVNNNPQIDFLYLKGNHDIKGLYDQSYDNLKQFNDDWTYYTYDNIVIAGVELTNDNYSNIYSTLKLEKNRINIVMLHGEIGKSMGVQSIKISNLVDKNIDYLALGHLHSYQSKIIDSRGIYAYSGCLEGRGFDECGDKGFVEIEIKDNKIIHKFIPSSLRKIQDITIDISNSKSLDKIKDKVQKETDKYSNDDILKVTIKGEIPYNLRLDEDDIKSAIISKHFVKVLIKTMPEIDVEKYKDQMSLKGRFIKMINSNNELTDEEKKKAIAVGIRALEEGEVYI